MKTAREAWRLSGLAYRSRLDSPLNSLILKTTLERLFRVDLVLSKLKSPRAIADSYQPLVRQEVLVVVALHHPITLQRITKILGKVSNIFSKSTSMMSPHKS